MDHLKKGKRQTESQGESKVNFKEERNVEEVGGEVDKRKVR